MPTDAIPFASSSLPRRQEIDQDAPRVGLSKRTAFRQFESMKSKGVEMVDASEAAGPEHRRLTFSERFTKARLDES
jgi:hypothetical protein